MNGLSLNADRRLSHDVHKETGVVDLGRWMYDDELTRYEAKIGDQREDGTELYATALRYRPTPPNGEVRDK